MNPGSNEPSSLAKTLLMGFGGGVRNVIELLKKRNNKIQIILADMDHVSLQYAESLSDTEKWFLPSPGGSSWANIEVAQASVKKSANELRKFLTDISALFLVSSLGGGIGSGCPSLVARMALEMGVRKVFGIFELPFKFEGKKRQESADRGLMNSLELMEGVITFSMEEALIAFPDLLDKSMVEALKSLDQMFCDLIFQAFIRLKTHSFIWDTEFQGSILSSQIGQTGVFKFFSPERHLR